MSEKQLQKKNVNPDKFENDKTCVETIVTDFFVKLQVML